MRLEVSILWDEEHSSKAERKYSATSLQQPPVGQHNSGCCREEAAMKVKYTVKLHFGDTENWLLQGGGCYREVAVVGR